MITDEQLYKLALFLGTAAMLLIVLYHFLEVNSRESKQVEQQAKDKKMARKI
jgi:oligosaccharyl transferase complex subunit OST4